MQPEQRTIQAAALQPISVELNKFGWRLPAEK